MDFFRSGDQTLRVVYRPFKSISVQIPMKIRQAIQVNCLAAFGGFGVDYLSYSGATLGMVLRTTFSPRFTSKTTRAQ